MTRRLSASERTKLTKHNRQIALDRMELRFPTAQRRAPDGPMSFPIKVVDAESEAAIRAFIEKRDA